MQKLKTPSETIQSFEQQECDVKALREELRKAKLYNELLNTMIDIAEDQLKIDIRKSLAPSGRNIRAKESALCNRPLFASWY